MFNLPQMSGLRAQFATLPTLAVIVTTKNYPHAKDHRFLKVLADGRRTNGECHHKGKRRKVEIKGMSTCVHLHLPLREPEVRERWEGQQ